MQQAISSSIAQNHKWNQNLNPENRLDNVIYNN